ncbi:MAG: hypothetical protein HY254_12170, partial [Burkholderiales bacterium]|nr:hypothetical protein [Burkholderiales bacterium]
MNIWRMVLRAQLIVLMSLLNSGCESTGKLPPVATPSPIPAPIEIFSESDVASTFVHAETSDAYCNMVEAAVFKSNLLAAVNLLRATEQKCGEQVFPASTPLVWNVKLQKAAYEHSSQMAITNVVSHTSIDARRPSDRVHAVGYQFAML